MHAKAIYTCAGANKASSVADINAYGLLAYAAGSVVCLWETRDSTHNGVHETLLGHQGTLTAVRFCHGQSPYLISGDALGNFRIWQHQQDQWNCVATQNAHEGSLSCLTILQHPSERGRVIIVTAGSDSLLKVWQYATSEQVELASVVDLHGKLPLAISATFLWDTSDLLIALALTDIRISFYACALEHDIKLACTVEGHSDWVRAVDFSPAFNDSHLLASGAQDNYVRLWRISLAQDSQKELDLLDDNLGISLRTHEFQPNGSNNCYSIQSESVLFGHEGWITDLSWSLRHTSASPMLASTSTDRSLVIWEQDSSASLWLNKARLGELGGSSGLGFYGALFSNDSQSVYAHDWTGSIHVWHATDSRWESGIGISGHFNSVQNLDWQAQGQWLISTGLDQTTRIHSRWKRSLKQARVSTWHEVARPQTHGHDIFAVSFVDKEKGLRFASGADETIIRLFEAPSDFVQRLESLGCDGLPDSSTLPNSAIVPPLGLSNRSVPNNAQEESNYKRPNKISLGKPPVEEELMAGSLWPEYDKLYGHGFEIRCLTTSHSGKILASSSRATSLEYASVQIRDTMSNQPIGSPLQGHTLSITSISFSPDDRFILAVGRDRSWHIYQRSDDNVYMTFSSRPKAHSRIIWDCAWLSNRAFVTVSRDKTVKLWNIANDQVSEVQCLTFESAVTAVDTKTWQNKTLIAIGLESGALFIHALAEGQLSELGSIKQRSCHNSTVNALAFSPSDSELLIASAGADRLLRVHEIGL